MRSYNIRPFSAVAGTVKLRLSVLEAGENFNRKRLYNTGGRGNDEKIHCKKIIAGLTDTDRREYDYFYCCPSFR